MKTQCPHCQKDYEVEAACTIPESQEISLTLKCESEYFGAESIGKVITNMAAIQEGVAKNLGVKVSAFIKSIDLKPNEITIRFFIVTLNQPAGKRQDWGTPCGCRKCSGPQKPTEVRFIVCPTCGNKRCPHASDHDYPCTGSNEPGQEGSVFA